jgi:predicted ATPase/DNA-binding SARP family transcriptional activator
MECQIELLAGLRITQGSRVITRFQTQKTGALLAYLAFYAERRHSREALAETIWSEDPPEVARRKLRIALASLRRQLEPPGTPPGGLLIADRPSIQFRPGAISTDVARFEEGLKRAVRAGEGSACTRELAAAVELYRGDLLPGYYESWIEMERPRLAEAFFQALERLVRSLETRGDLGGAIHYARRAVAADPLREEAHHELIRLLGAAGQQAAARRQYELLQRILTEELDAQPSPATRALLRIPGAGEAADSPTRCDRPGASRPPFVSSLDRTVSLPAHPRIGTITFLLVGPAEAADSDPDPGRSLAKLGEGLAREAKRCGGRVSRTREGFLLARFTRPSDALSAALALCQEPESAGVRMALHTEEGTDTCESASVLAGGHVWNVLAAAHPGQILCSEAATVLLRRLPGGRLDVQLIDLGLHRLPGAAGMTERLSQVVAAGMPERAFPAPNAAPPEGSLPRSLTPFFGRVEEIARLQNLLLTGAARLVTLTGPGGSGKTRLAIAVAGRVAAAFDGGAWFVPLDAVTEPEQIADAVRESLRLPASGHVTPWTQVRAALSRGPALLVLDNCEHLLPALATAVRDLLESVPSLVCLATSRRRLEAPGERTVALGPLPTPHGNAPPELLIACPSVQLFVDRAQAVRPDFQVTPRNAAAVAALCDRLEGLPLALELAAARAAALAPAQLLARLEQRFDLLVSRRHDARARHRSLRAALEWSYDLLSPSQQRLYARLALFHGGWDLEAAEAIGGSGTPPASGVLEALEEFCASSLVIAREGESEVRYHLLESLREFAAEQLTPDVHADAAQKHAAHYLTLAERAVPELRRRDQIAWTDRLTREQDNFRAALEWATRTGTGDGKHPATEIGLRLAGALGWFWTLRGHLTEGRRRLAALLSLPGAALPTLGRARALHQAGRIALWQGDQESARTHAEEAVAIFRQLGDRLGLAGPLDILGHLAIGEGPAAEARAIFEECIRIYREHNDPWGVAQGLAHAGNAEYHGDHKNLEAGRALHEESLARMRELGDGWSMAYSLNVLGEIALVQEEHASARNLLAESLALWQKLDASVGICACLVSLGQVALLEGRMDRAIRLVAAGEALRNLVGNHPRAGTNIVREQARAALGDAAFMAAWTEAHSLPLDQAIAFALEG